jgi:rhodanese-related sulfurtransferase
VAASLIAARGAAPAVHVAGGMSAWKRSGYPTVE